MSQGPLCPNLTKKVQKEVSQIASRNLSCVMLLGGLSVNLNHLIIRDNPKPKTLPNSNVMGAIKSPSDTTIYAPALHHLNDNPHGMSTDVAMEKISNFVEGIRLETQHRITPVQGPSANNSPQPGPSRSRPQPDRRIVEQEDPELEAAKQQILEAEQYNATVEPPPKGNIHFPEIDLVKRSESEDYNDDDFFHLTCHVDKSLKAKIEQGEYVDLEKLIPKKKFKHNTEDSRLEWVTRDGMTFLAPAQDRECQINSIRCWEQAFRVYAAIYCNANPTRSGEIWQYIHTINSAATSYQWDNVQYYDTVFRQTISEKPGRRWSKTFVQLWQLALRDPIQKNTGNNQINRPFQTNDQGPSSARGRQKNWRDYCCWKFNKTGKCNKDNCQFDKRCSYCGMWNSHGANSCRKKQAGEKDTPPSGTNPQGHGKK